MNTPLSIALFSSKPYDQSFFNQANEQYGFHIHYLEHRLTMDTVQAAAGHDVICAFVHDELNPPVLERIAKLGIKTVALRCAGFNNVDIDAATKLQINIVRVPRYSPHSVAEHSVALMLALNRKLHRACNRVREGNFELNGLLGFDMHNKTVGIIGTGNIGSITARILKAGLNMRVLACDPAPNETCQALGVEYVELDTLYSQSDIISLHCPLTPDSHHLINANAISRMKPGVMLINTSRGEVVDTKAVTEGLKSGQIGYLGLDVYEQEGDLFFRDLSGQVIRDDVFERLLTFPNVIVTGHQGFFTTEALQNIATTTLQNISACTLENGCQNLVTQGFFK